MSHHLDRDICELFSNAYDFLLEERTKKRSDHSNKAVISPEMLTDAEFDTAFEVIRRNDLPLKSVKISAASEGSGQRTGESSGKAASCAARRFHLFPLKTRNI